METGHISPRFWHACLAVVKDPQIDEALDMTM